MGAFLDCCRGPNADDNCQSGSGITPDKETRRQAAAEAANRRLQQSEHRGVDEDELRRMKQRQIDRDHLEEQNKKLSTQSGGLRWQMN